MSINGISANVSTPSVTTTPAAVIPPKPKEATAPSQPYTVKLTGSALAKSLKQAGQNPAQIALKMGVDVKTVDSYLSIKVASSTPAPATPIKQAVAAAYSPVEEVKEPAAEKATEKAQGKK